MEFALTRINSSSGQLPQAVVSGIAILPGQQHPRLPAGIIHHHHDNRTRMADDVATDLDASRLFDPFRGDVKDRTAKHHALLQHAQAWLALVCHQTNISAACASQFAFRVSLFAKSTLRVFAVCSSPMLFRGSPTASATG